VAPYAGNEVVNLISYKDLNPLWVSLSVEQSPRLLVSKHEFQDIEIHAFLFESRCCFSVAT